MEFLYAILVQKVGHQGEKEYSLFPAGGTITLSVHQKSNDRGITVRFVLIFKEFMTFLSRINK